jgi:hypothetical protein
MREWMMARTANRLLHLADGRLPAGWGFLSTIYYFLLPTGRFPQAICPKKMTEERAKTSHFLRDSCGKTGAKGVTFGPPEGRKLAFLARKMAKKRPEETWQGHSRT